MTDAPPPADAAPLFLVLSGPSGAGKDTLLEAVLQRDPRCERVATAKTRPPRPVEIEGVHHLFLSDAQFEAMRAAGGFLEHAAVYGHRSGVPRAQVQAAMDRGKTVLVRTDLQGARTLRARVPGAILAFVTVPDRETLERRLRRRNVDSEADLGRRLDAAAGEMAQADLFDYVIVNRDGEEERAIEELLAIIRKERAASLRRLPQL